MSGDEPRIALSGGVVAYNERTRIGPAIASLFAQRLPPGTEWSEIHVIVSGSTDGTDDVVRTLAASDPRIRLVFQPEREGKASALAEVFARARGDYLVLLNADAVAAPDAVAELLGQAGTPMERFAVMGRPVPRRATTGTFADAVGLLWAIHHSFHLLALGVGEGNHLSDELLLLPVRHLPPIGMGIVNDGSFVGAWLSRNGGTLRYAPGAIVRITSPRTLREHVRQRRRILYGHLQIHERMDVAPTTVERYALSHPLAAARLVARDSRRPGGVLALVTLLAAEVVAVTLGAFDARSHRRDHVRWQPIIGTSPDSGLDTARSAISSDGG
jgi:biofilm PGA synthesis N-glycosyltransferase PgaC